MLRITYGEDQKELKASNPQAIEYLLKKRLNKNNIVSDKLNDKLSNKVVQNKTKIVIVAPTITDFFKKVVSKRLLRQQKICRWCCETISHMKGNF